MSIQTQENKEYDSIVYVDIRRNVSMEKKFKRPATEWVKLVSLHIINEEWLLKRIYKELP